MFGRSLLCVVAVLVVATPSVAQSNSQVYAGVRFDLPVPGARSLALGGAFVPLADDATAAVSNPAGLTNLIRPEFSIEGRGWNFTTVTPRLGHAYGTPINVGFDTVPGIQDIEIDRDSAALSFLSAVFPAGRFTIGGYRHQQARYRADVSSDGFYVANALRTNPFTGTMELDIVNYGVSLGYRFEGGLSLGGGIAYSDFSINSTLHGYYLWLPVSSPEVRANPSAFTRPGWVYGPPDFSEGNRLNTLVESGDDNGVGVNFGALYKPPSGKFSIGAAVRLGPEFQYGSENRWGPGGKDPNTGTPFNPVGTLSDQDDLVFKVPDAYSFGAAIHLTDVLMVSAQYDHTRYSQLSDDILYVLGGSNVDLGQDPAATVGDEVILQEDVQRNLAYPDSNAIRIGTEYAVARGTRVFALRFGTAYETDHSLRYEDTQNTNGVLQQVNLTLFREQPAQWHFTPGIGFAASKFQVDAAIDLADLSRTFSISTVFRF